MHRALGSLGAAIGLLIAFWILSVVIDGFRAVFVFSPGFVIVGRAVLLLIVPNLRPRRQAALPGSADRPEPGRVSLRSLGSPQPAKLVGAATLRRRTEPGSPSW